MHTSISHVLCQGTPRGSKIVRHELTASRMAVMKNNAVYDKYRQSLALKCLPSQTIQFSTKLPTEKKCLSCRTKHWVSILSLTTLFHADACVIRHSNGFLKRITFENLSSTVSPKTWVVGTLRGVGGKVKQGGCCGKQRGGSPQNQT